MPSRMAPMGNSLKSQRCALVGAGIAHSSPGSRSVAESVVGRLREETAAIGAGEVLFNPVLVFPARATRRADDIRPDWPVGWQAFVGEQSRLDGTAAAETPDTICAPSADNGVEHRAHTCSNPLAAPDRQLVGVAELKHVRNVDR